MKKLSLKNLKFGDNELLQRNQLKMVSGGYKPDGFDCALVFDTCDYIYKFNFSEFERCMISYGC